VEHHHAVQQLTAERIQDARPSDAAVRRTRWLTAAGLATTATIATTAHFLKPGQDPWLPHCPFHALTGWWCPVCGSTRAAAALMQGHVAAAFWHNVLFLPALAVILWALAVSCVRSLRPDLASRSWLRSPWSLRGRWLWILPVLLAVFWVLRNLPGAPERLLSS